MLAQREGDGYRLTRDGAALLRRRSRRSTPGRGTGHPMGRRRSPPVSPPPASGSLHFAVVEADLDLHHLTAGEAAVQLESFLLAWSRRRTGAVLRVITGRGNRSAGGPVLRPRVRELLTGRLAPLVADYALESGGGAYLVRVRGEG